MNNRYKPLGDRVIIKIIKERDEKTAGGLLKPSGNSDTFIGQVVEVGTGLFTQTGNKIPMTVSSGDKVLLQGTGVKHKDGGETLHIYRESDILTIIEPASKK